MVRTFHQVLHFQRALWQYVDDLLVIPEKTSAPAWISSLTILSLCLGIPMSWHKTMLDSEVTWIGWSINVQLWRVCITDDKWTFLRPPLGPFYRALQDSNYNDLSITESMDRYFIIYFFGLGVTEVIGPLILIYGY